MSSTKETKSGSKSGREPLIERAAALIEEDALSESAGKEPQQHGAERRAPANGDVEIRPGKASDDTDQHRPEDLEKPLQGGNPGETGNRSTSGNGNGTVNIMQARSRRSQIFLPGLDQSRSIEEFRQTWTGLY